MSPHPLAYEKQSFDHQLPENQIILSDSFPSEFALYS